MVEPRIVRIYLEKPLRESAEARQHNFLSLVAQVLDDRGYRVVWKTSTPRQMAQGALRPGYSLTHMKPPVGSRGLVFRRAYHYPFWQIDQTDARWNWQVARTAFPGRQSAEASGFFRRWRARLFGEVAPTRGGYLYVPLQGQIRDHRSFQTCSPLDMLRDIRAQRPGQQIIATLHPKERYDPEDLKALAAVQDDLLQVETGQLERFLPHCDAVITMNSSAAFAGYFLEKPALLYGQIDFHHIALTPQDWGILDDHAPDYAGYIHWFWQVMSINAGHASAKDKIAAKLDGFGWP